MPTLELADGSVIRDSSAVSEYFEEDTGHTFSPVTAKQRIVSGTSISALAQPYRFYLLKRVQDDYASLDTDDKVAVDATLEACNMAPVLSATLTRDVGLQNNLEVWL